MVIPLIFPLGPSAPSPLFLLFCVAISPTEPDLLFAPLNITV